MGHWKCYRKIRGGWIYYAHANKPITTTKVAVVQDCGVEMGEVAPINSGEFAVLTTEGVFRFEFHHAQSEN